MQNLQTTNKEFRSTNQRSNLRMSSRQQTIKSKVKYKDQMILSIVNQGQITSSDIKEIKRDN